jgi:hypothetical protein
MLALLKHTFPLALALFGACSGSGADDEVSSSPPASDSAALSQAGAPPETAVPLPLTEEELQRLLDALEQEIGGRK